MTLLTRHGHVACRDSPSTQAARGHTFPLAFIRRLCTVDLNHVSAQSVCHDVVPVAVFNTTFFVVPRDAVWPGRYGHCRLRSKILANLVAFRNGPSPLRIHIMGLLKRKSSASLALIALDKSPVCSFVHIIAPEEYYERDCHCVFMPWIQECRK